MPRPSAQHDLERLVLGAFVVSPQTFWQSGQRLRPAMMLDDEHRRVLEVIIERAHTGNSFSINAVGALYEQRYDEDIRSKLTVAASEVTDELEVVADYVDQLVAAYRVREVRKLGEVLVKQSRKPDVDPDELMAGAQVGLDAIREDVRTHETELHELMSQIAERMDAIHTGGGHEQIGESWGLRTLDDMVGPIQERDLIVLAASSGSGKTAAAMQAARAISKRKRVLFFALDQQPSDIAQREVAAATGASVHDIRTGQFSAADIAEAIEAAARARAQKLTMIRKPGMTWHDIRFRTLSASRVEPLGLVVIDHIKSVRGSDRRKSQFEVISEVMFGARELTGEANVPVLLLAQRTRSSQQERTQRPSRHDLFGGGVIDETADMVLLLWRPDPARPDTYLICDKHRSMAVTHATRCVAFDGAKMQFEDLDHEPQAPDERGGGRNGDGDGEGAVNGNGRGATYSAWSGRPR